MFSIFCGMRRGKENKNAKKLTPDPAKKKKSDSKLNQRVIYMLFNKFSVIDGTFIEI